MSQRISSWKALLFSVLTYCVSPSSQENKDAGNHRISTNECFDALPCTPESFEEQCDVSLYGIFSTQEALTHCLDEYKVYFSYGPHGDLACFRSGSQNPVNLFITSCGNTPEPFENVDYNKIISYRRVSPDQLGLDCKIPCADRSTPTFLTPVPQLLPEEQTLLVRTGVHTANLELLLSLYPSDLHSEPCFRVGYCVIPR